MCEKVGPSACCLEAQQFRTTLVSACAYGSRLQVMSSILGIWVTGCALFCSTCIAKGWRRMADLGEHQIVWVTPCWKRTVYFKVGPAVVAIGA